jgi:hypothetical protein
MSGRDRWGPPAWIFFHVYAEKINEEYYKVNYKNIMSQIRNICNSIPCPFCQKHANEYLRKINDNRINTKELLKRFFFNFHNNTNKITHKPIHNYDILKKYEKYDRKQTIDCINKFYAEFFFEKKMSRLLNGWQININKKKFKNWILGEIQHLTI